MDAVNAVRKSRKKPMPPDFPALAPTMTIEELMARYGCGGRVVRRWSKESGAGYKGALGAIPTPDDFAQVAPLHTQNELRRMYGRSGSVIARWAREADVTLKRVRRPCVRRDPAEEAAICLNCPLPQCRYGKCARIGRGQ